MKKLGMVNQEEKLFHLISINKEHSLVKGHPKAMNNR